MGTDPVLVDLHCLIPVHVHDLHEPAGIVRPDRNHHEVERAAARADLPELWMVGRVTSVEDTFSVHLERKAAPERTVSVAQPAATEMSGGRRGDLERPTSGL